MPSSGPGESGLLHHRRVTGSDREPQRWLIVLHGIYGAGRNWGTIARGVVEERPDRGVLLVDLRGHGASPTLAPPHTVARAAEDVRRLIESFEGTVDAVLGHSFGGKVALAVPRGGADIEVLWVVDSNPGRSAPGGSAWRMLSTLRAMPGPFPTREAAIGALTAHGWDAPVAVWMATNLEVTDGGLAWRIDVDQMEALLLDFFALDLWEAVEAPLADREVHVVKAERSSVLSEDACARVVEAGRRTSRVHLHRIDGGHWLNADAPEALVGLLSHSLPRVSSG